MGHKPARETLCHEYGQPHVVAYCCEKRVLNFLRLKSKDPVGLRNLSVLMDKSLAMLQNIREFATLNSLGTVQKITENLPHNMQRDWVKRSFRVLKTPATKRSFLNFIRNEADEVNSLYRKILYRRRKRSEVTVSQPAYRKSAVFSTVAAT